MATFQGVRSPDVGVYKSDRSVNFDSLAPPAPTGWKGVLLTTPTSGALVVNLPVPAVPGLTLQGTRGRTFADDFYNNVYLFPQDINFDSITDDVQRSVQVWNAFLSSTTVNAITPGDPVDDVEISGLGIPSQLAPIGVGNYTFTALKDGPANLDVQYTFQFSQGDPLVLTLTGRRGQELPLSVNWKRPFKVNYQFETEILTSHSGKEQRRSILQEPRKSIEFSVLIRDSAQFEQFRRLMLKNHNDIWIIPEVTKRVYLSSGIPVNGQTFTLDTVPTWLVAGIQVVLKDAGQSALNVVDSVSGNTVTLKAPVAEPWSTKAHVSPGLTCRISTRLTTTVHTDAVGELSLSADVVPGSEAIPVVGGAGLTLKGREIFLKKPNWARGIIRTDVQEKNVVDFGAGTVSYYSPIEFASIIQQMDFLNKNTLEADEITDFFMRCRGRQGEFYMSNRDRDMELAQPIVANDTVLRIKNQDVLFFKDETTRAAILIQLNDETVLPHTVVDMVEVNDGDGSDTLVTLGEPVTQSIALAQLDRISWLVVWRLGSDTLSMEWLTDRVAQTRLSAQSLEDLVEE